MAPFLPGKTFDSHIFVVEPPKDKFRWRITSTSVPCQTQKQNQFSFCATSSTLRLNLSCTNSPWLRKRIFPPFSFSHDSRPKSCCISRFLPPFPLIAPFYITNPNPKDLKAVFAYASRNNPPESRPDEPIPDRNAQFLKETRKQMRKQNRKEALEGILEGTQKETLKETLEENRDVAVNQVVVPFYRPVPFIDIPAKLGGLDTWQRYSLAVVWLTSLAAVTWLLNLNASGLVDDTEPLFVEAARQMLVTGDFVTPQFNAMPRFDKPPLIYYFMALSMRIFGPHVWAARLPSALCATFLATAIFASVAKFSTLLPPLPDSSVPETNNLNIGNNSNTENESNIGLFWTAAFAASAAFCLNLVVLVWSSTALSDMLLTASVGGALLSLFWNYAKGQKKPNDKINWALPLSALFTTFAVLAKGPVGLVLPVGVWLSFLLVTGELHQSSLVPSIKWLVSVGAMAAPWFCYMHHLHGSEYTSTFFGYHNVERYVQGVNHHGGRPWWYGLVVVIMGYFPWSLSLLPSLLRIVPWSSEKRLWWKQQPRAKRLPLLASVWFLFTFAFFGLSASQLPSYYLPLAVPIALLGSSHLTEQKNGGSLIAAGAYQLLAGLVWLLPSILSSNSDPKVAEISALVASNLIHVRGLILLGMGGMLATRTTEFKTSHSSILQVTVTAPGGAPKVDQKRESSFLPLWVLHAGIMILFISFFFRPLYVLCDKVLQEPLRQIAQLAAESKLPGEALLMIGTRMPSTVFYARNPVAFVESVSRATQILQEASSRIPSALIITETVFVEKLGEVQILASNHAYSLLRKMLGS